MNFVALDDDFVEDLFCRCLVDAFGEIFHDVLDSFVPCQSVGW